jgi:sulfate adenylyltransferase
LLRGACDVTGLDEPVRYAAVRRLTEVAVTAGAQADRDVAQPSMPSWTLTGRQLGDLELILSGAFAPLRGFMTAADVASVASAGALADGTPWPIPVTLEIPADVIAADASQLVLTDPEGTPLAVLTITERHAVEPGQTGHDAAQHDAAQHETAQHETAQHETGQHETGHDETEHAGSQYDETGHDRPQHNETEHDRPQHNETGHDGAGPTEAGRAEPQAAGLVRLAGPVAANRVPEHGSFRRLMIPPELARAELGDSPVLGFATSVPLGSRQIGQLRHLAGQLRAKVLLLPLVGGPAAIVRQPEALIRAVLAAAASLPAGTLVVPVPLAPRDDVAGPGPTRDLAAAAIVAAAYGATHLMAQDWTDRGASAHGDIGTAAAAGPIGAMPGAPIPALPDGSIPALPGAPIPALPGGSIPALPGAPIPVLPSGDWAYDPNAEVWRPLALIETGSERADLAPDQLADMLDTGAPIPAWVAPQSVVAELRRARRPRAERGLVVFLTGLSGSGKSTIARDLRDLLAERSDRRVSLLDGDLVRALLSAGLTFSRADRDLNIARIGYVATEIARHGGIAICAPIAPYAAARDRVRRMVCEVGDFVLIHVATPVQVCEARDRKGLYAKARAGLIGQFTGISDPYEEPTDAMAVIDTSVLSRDQATESIMALLTDGGWLSPAG